MSLRTRAGNLSARQNAGSVCLSLVDCGTSGHLVSTNSEACTVPMHSIRTQSNSCYTPATLAAERGHAVSNGNHNSASAAARMRRNKWSRKCRQTARLQELLRLE